MRIRFVHWCVLAAMLANGAVWYWQKSAAPVVISEPTERVARLVLVSELNGGDKTPGPSPSAEQAFNNSAAVARNRPPTDEPAVDAGQGAATPVTAAAEVAEAVERELADVAEERSVTVEEGLAASPDAAAPAEQSGPERSAVAPGEDPGSDSGFVDAGTSAGEASLVETRQEDATGGLNTEGISVAEIPAESDAYPATSAGEPGDDGAATASPQEAVAESAALARCWLAGPVVDDQLGVELAAAFAEAGINMDLVLQTVEAELEYWVYVPAAATPEQRLERSQALRAAGIESFPITDGPLAGSLSMGLFRSEDRAQAMQERLRISGFAANIYPRPRYRDEAWIALDEPTRMALGWPDQGGELPGYEGITLRPRECP